MIISSTRLYFLFICLFAISGCTNHQDEKVNSIDPPEEELDKQSRMDLVVEQEFEMTHDPALGRIPTERLFEVKRNLRDNRNSSTNQRDAIPGIIWTERGPNNVSGRIRDILIDAADPTGNTIYGGSVGGGLWKCENALSSNPSWHSVDDFFENLAVCAIAQDPSNSDVMYFGTGEGYYNGDAIRGVGLWKSTNGGDSWDYLESTSSSSFRHIQQIIINSNGTVFAATRAGGVQSSSDGGITWGKVLGSGVSASTNSTADLELAADGTLYAAMGIGGTDGIYKSSNNGTNWTKLSSGLPTSDYERIELACAPSNANVVYALFQDESNNECKGIYRTANGGTSWVSKNNPSAVGMSNFSRNQAWYDLIAAVDPNDADRVFIGGVDLLLSNSGGNSWQQISQWYGGNGMQYVHADQHAIKFLPGSSSVAFFGNDGGVFATSNANASVPTIDFISNGFNVTQFYSCAIHPEADEDYFLAGAQDNGTQQFTDTGLNNTNEVTGGDGAFCHIDQDNPQIQISTYIYNNYRVSTNGGNSFTSRNLSDEGRFINPFAYDDATNKIYGSNTSDTYLRWNNPATVGFDYDNVSVTAFSGSKVSHVTASPNVENRIYFGLSNGDLVYVDDAHIGTSKSGTVIRAGFGYLSSIAIETGNEDHIILTYSNYGVTSVFETNNGGTSWTSVEGNLPDIPVRWVIFSPTNANEALLATEVGVWSTNNLDGSNTTWEPSNSGLANVRVDMLKTRESDDLVIAATHGRGLFSTSRFSSIYAGFVNAESNVLEYNSVGAEGDCELHFQEMEIPVSINRLPLDQDEVILYFNVANTSSATENEDFLLLTDSLVFNASDVSLQKNIEIKILDDAIEETNLENIVLDISLSGAAQISRGTHTIEIKDNDRSPLDLPGNIEAIIGMGTEQDIDFTPFRGYWHDSKAQYLFQASELTAQGLVEGRITDLAFLITEVNSSLGYTGFTIGLKNSDAASLADLQDFETGFTQVYSADHDPVQGWNNFEFLSTFEWDGQSNLLIQTCFDNQDYTLDDAVRSSETAFVSSAIRYLDNDNGCSIEVAGQLNSTRPNIRLRQNDEASVADQMVQKNSFVTENETANFYGEDEKIILSVKNLAGGDIGCLDVQIDNYGTNQQSPSWLSGANHGEKTFLLSGENETPYELTLYFTEAELAAWADPTALSILKTSGAVSSQNSSDFLVLDPLAVNVVSFGESNHYAFKATFESFGGFTLTDSDPVSPLPLSLINLKVKNIGASNEVSWETTQEENVNYMEVQRSFDGEEFLLLGQVAALNNADNINRYQYPDEDLQKKEVDYYYRLKTVDLGGSYTYSEIVSVFVSGKETEAEVFPNPFTETITIRPAADRAVKSMILNDASGKHLKEYNNSQHVLDLHQLTPGVYWLSLIYENGKTEVHRIVKTI